MNFEKLISINKVKLILASVVIGVCLTGAIQSYSKKVMADISSNVIRLHIIANSDSENDQNLKLKVRNEIIEYLKPLLKNASNVEETKKIINNNIKAIENVAEKAIKKDGYTYCVTANFGNYKFPTKAYENARFPKGNYDALRIVIGNGAGKNWWCVLYPQLCFTGGTDGTLSDEGEARLKNVLTDDEYEMITSDKINFKFRIVEWFSD